MYLSSYVVLTLFLRRSYVDYRVYYVGTHKVQVEVGQSATNAQSVNLPLVVGMVSLTCNDATPQEATSMESNCSITENIPPKGVSFSDFFAIFAMSYWF